MWQMQLHLTALLPSHQRGQGQLSKNSPHRDRVESCKLSPLQAPHSSKRQQLQPALRAHTQAVQAPRLFSLGKKCQELEKLEVFLSNLVEESSVATEQVCLLMPGYLSQEIWESGQLKNVSINFPSLHFPTTTLLLHKLTGTEQSKTDPDEHI